MMRISLVVAAFAVAQEFVENTPPPIDEVEKEKPQKLRCFTGNANYKEDRRKPRRCRGKNKVCQTKVEAQPNDGPVSIISRCKPRNVCENNRQNHRQQCVESRGARVCHYCCDVSGCNDLESISELMNFPQK